MKLTGQIANIAPLSNSAKTSVTLEIFGNHAADLEGYGSKMPFAGSFAVRSDVR